MTDGELLQRYVRDQSESAFAELVGDYVLCVYVGSLSESKNSTVTDREVNFKAVAMGEIKVKVPADPSSGTIDVGTVELKTAPAAQ